MKRLLSIALFLLVGGLSAQETHTGKDLKVGLVLSGGGAKGLAHASVLKVIEEAGVRVDYIGGTSMGAMIGALYASGYNADQLDSLVRSIEFDKILLDDVPRKSKPFYKKESGEDYALTLPIKENKVGIPMAISEGQNVLNLFTRLTQHVSHINDFNELPIPFVCIATDLETGQQVTLDSGFLPEAVKASGSFPTLLAPVEVDGRLLTDGGVVNNFPVEEVKAMGADIIIGVDIQSGLGDRGDLDSFVKIVNQIVGFQMYKTLPHKYEMVDLLIKPDMEGYNVVSFDKMEEIMTEGEVASRALFDALKEIASRQDPTRRERLPIKVVNKFHVKQIEITGNNNYTRAYIQAKLNLRKRDSTSYDNLIASINNLTATGNFESVQYNIVEEEDGVILKFRVKENRISNFLQIGAHYDQLYKTGIVLNLTSKHVINKNDVISADVVLGDHLRYNFNYFIDHGFYTSVGIRSRFNSFDTDLNFDSANVNKINVEYEDFTNQVYLQTVFSRRFALGIGAEHKRIKVFTETVSSEDNGQQGISESDRLYFDKSDYFNLISYLKIDTYDRSFFPRQGIFMDVGFRWYLASTDYHENFKAFSQLKGKGGFAYTFFDALTFQFNTEAGITIGDNENRALDYNVGGYGEKFVNNFIPLYGYDFAALNANSFLRSAFTLRYTIFPKNYVMATANYARVERDLFNEGRIFENTKSGYMIGYGLETILGPIELHYSWSPELEENHWYFSVGYWF
jgi:NTE family protein